MYLVAFHHFSCHKLPSTCKLKRQVLYLSLYLHVPVLWGEASSESLQSVSDVRWGTSAPRPVCSPGATQANLGPACTGWCGTSRLLSAAPSGGPHTPWRTCQRWLPRHEAMLATLSVQSQKTEVVIQNVCFLHFLLRNTHLQKQATAQSFVCKIKKETCWPFLIQGWWGDQSPPAYSDHPPTS